MGLPDMCSPAAAWLSKGWSVVVNSWEVPPVDSGYRGEIHAILSNVSSQTRHIPKGSRIGQLVITPVVIADFVTELGEQRGTGAFGSTGK